MTVSDVLQSMAKQAWSSKIKGQSLKRNALLMPLNILFDEIRQEQPVLDREAVRAASCQLIFDYLDRISELGRGKKTSEGSEIIVNHFFHDLLDTCYAGKLPQLLRDEKALKAAYLFYIRKEIPTKEPNA